MKLYKDSCFLYKERSQDQRDELRREIHYTDYRKLKEKYGSLEAALEAEYKRWGVDDKTLLEMGIDVEELNKKLPELK